MSEYDTPPWDVDEATAPIDVLESVEDLPENPVGASLRSTITLAPQQAAAVKSFKSWFDTPRYTLDGGGDFFLLNGYAGTGKSTILPFIIDEAGLSPQDVLFVAPTGKASKVMATKLAAQGMLGCACMTIHKAIYRPKMMAAFLLERELGQLEESIMIARNAGHISEMQEMNRRAKQLRKDLERAYDEKAPKFQLNVEARLADRYKLIVVDECSMVGEDIAEDLLSFGVPTLAIGDPFQLQPVQSNPGFCIREADAALTEVHRQAADNPIIWASMQVRAGKPLQLGSHGDGRLRVITKKDDDKTYDLDLDAQILIGTHRKRWQITREIRKLSGLDAVGPATGELMIVNKNSLRYPSLVNGTMVMVEDDVGELKRGAVTFQMRVRDEEGRVYDTNCIQAVIEEHYLGAKNSTAPKSVVFRESQKRENDQIDFGYAITVHKSQGSQWNEVVLHDESRVFRDQADQHLYTGITRAAEKLTVVIP